MNRLPREMVVEYKYGRKKDNITNLSLRDLHEEKIDKVEELQLLN